LEGASLSAGRHVIAATYNGAGTFLCGVSNPFEIIAVL
jgi:hypothetical protein